jgi:hypothetical protein
MIDIGFTGTRQGMSPSQLERVRKLLELHFHGSKHSWFHHGDCIGADTQAREVAKAIGYQIHCHPPLDPSNRAWTEFDLRDPEYSYHGRNQRIVKACNSIIGAPLTYSNIGGGTWWTIDCARRMRKSRYIVFRDGEVLEEGEDAHAGT